MRKNMTRKTTIMLIALIIVSISGNAITVQKLVKTNGDELYGHIAVQNPKEEEIVFQADSSMETVDKIMNMDGKAVASFGNTLLQVKALRIMDDGKAVCKVMRPHSVTIKWDEIEAIYAVSDDKNTISGLEREYTTSNGSTYSGSFIKQTYGGKSNITLRSVDGQESEIQLANVIYYKTIAKNPSQPITEQAKVTDVVEKNDGTLVGPGVITERNYQSEDPDSFYVLIHTLQGTKERIFLKDIKSFRIQENKQYKPCIINILEKGDMMVNGNKIGEAISLVPLHGNKEVLEFEGKSKPVAYISEKSFIKGGKQQTVICLNVPNKKYIIALDSKTDTCQVVFEVNAPTDFDSQSSASVIKDVEMEKDGRTLFFKSYATFQAMNASSFTKDGRSGTLQYKFNIPLPEMGKMNKAADGKYHCWSAIFLLKKQQIIPIEFVRNGK